MSLNIGDNIRKLRELRGLSQENVASDLGMSPTGFGKIERNEVSITIDKLTKVAKVLDTSIETILDFDDKTVFIKNLNPKINKQFGQYSPINDFDEIRKLYEKQIKLLEEKIQLLEEKINAKKNDN